MLDSLYANYISIIQNSDTIKLSGKVTDVIGLIIVSIGPNVSLGETCKIIDKDGNQICRTEVVGFKDGKVLSIALDDVQNIAPKSEIIAEGKPFSVGVGKELLGRVIDGMGNVMDGKGDIKFSSFRSIHRQPPSPLSRKRIDSVLQTGVRSLDGLLTMGKGQRVGIFSGSGVGKSILLGMIARNTNADVNVIALIGERGREVREFIERDLGEEGLKRSVVIVATSDKSALMRIKGAYLATTISEYFRDLGMDVLLMMDSVTRFAMAQREIGLASENHLPLKDTLQVFSQFYLNYWSEQVLLSKVQLLVYTQYLLMVTIYQNQYLMRFVLYWMDILFYLENWQTMVFILQ
jgi:flagellum-specific ATP synthase